MEELFRQYLCNECPQEKIPKVLALVQTPEGKALMDRLLQQMDTKTVESPSAEVSERLWRRLSYSIAQPETEIKTNPIRQPSQIWPLPIRRLGWAAAACLIPMLTAVGWWFLFQTKPLPTTITVRTHYGQTKQLQLPDGSVVVLNGNSMLAYSSDWSTNQPRKVWLTGEAFFRVTHQKNHQRFEVNTPYQQKVEVLGTEFNVSTRKKGTQVVLQSGQIRLVVQQNKVQKSLLLRPGQAVAMDTASRHVHLAQVKASRYTSWTYRKLEFDGTSLHEIAQLLEETYNLHVLVADKHLLDEKVTGTIPSGNVDELLQALAISLHLRYDRTDNQVTFY